MDKPNDENGSIDAPDLAHFLHHDHSGDTHPQSDPTGSEVNGDVLRDVEKALVERIADVDDDRRRTTLQMQKAWQSQRREIDDRLARQRRVLIGFVAALFVISIGGLAWLYLGLEDLRRAIDMRLATFNPIAVEAAIDPAEIDALEAQLTGRLESLSKRQDTQAQRLGVLADRLDSAAATQAEAAAGLDEAAAAQWIEPLRQRQASLEQELSGAVSGRLAAIEERQQTLAQDLAALTAQLSNALAEPAVPSNNDKAPIAAQASEELPADRVLRVGDRPYALQLLGAFDRNAVLELARRDLAGSKLYLREETYRGRPWYVLIHSLHPSRQAALDALEALPERLAGMDVWIRQLPEDTRLQLIEPARPSGGQGAGG
jgi:DamX protein